MSKKIWYLAFLSGILLALPWYNAVPGYILLFALVPLLIAEDFICERKNIYSSRLVFLISFLAFFIWNTGTIWWIIKISIMGALFTISANAMQYALMFWVYHLVKRYAGLVLGWVAFILFWLAFEYYSLHAEFTLPWLVLGNGLGNSITGIQWYEYTGALGGSLWILLGNLLVFNMFQYWKQQKYIRLVYCIFIGSVLALVPYFISIQIYNQPDESAIPCKVALIQPNIDPYTEKFNSLSQEVQLGRILTLANSIKDTDIDYYIAPETAIDNDIWENALMNNYSLFTIRNFINVHSNSRFLIGAITYKEYLKNEARKSITRYNPNDNIYFDVFNSALQIDSTFNTAIYHKSKLVLGVEKLPFPEVFHFFDKYLLKLGGSSGSLGQQREPTVFFANKGTLSPAPIICYESIYGEYVTKFVRKGANLIFIITNDGWWSGTTGYMQHLRCAQLRAIETRRSIARCANTGISAFINQKGIISNSTGWWEQTALVGTIRSNNRLTFYTRHGDFIGWIAVVFSILILLIALVIRVKK